MKIAVFLTEVQEKRTHLHWSRRLGKVQKLPDMRLQYIMSVR